MSATLPINTCRWLVRPDGEMDIISAFEADVPSSNLGRGTTSLDSEIELRSARTRNENTRRGMMPSEAGMVQW